MKQLTVFVFFSIIFITSHAQFHYGIQAGGGVATLHTTYIEKKFFHLTPSWTAGGFASYTFNKNFLAQTSLTYITKGYRDYIRETTIKYNDYYRVNYIEFIPQFFFTPILRDHKFLFGLGPSISYGLGGKWKQKVLSAQNSDTHGKLIFLNDDTNTDFNIGVYGKKIDFGGAASVGYEVCKKMTVLLNGTGSMLNIAPTQYGIKPNYTDRNVNLNLSVQYHIR